MQTQKSNGWMFVLLLIGALSGCAAFIQGMQEAQTPAPAATAPAP